MKGKIGIVLHSHIPYVINYGSWPHGTDWLYEASAETYIPLLIMLKRLAKKGIKAGITISFTPILLEQLTTEEFKSGFIEYLNMKIKYALENEKEFRDKNELHLRSLALMWLDFYKGVLLEFSQCEGDIVSEFRSLMEEGIIDIITSAATHAYLPLLKRDETVELQIKLGVKVYTNHFGRPPRGMWLPECGYRPSYIWKAPIGNYSESKRKGLEEILHDNGVEFFFVDKHLIEGGKPIGTYISRFELLRKLWEHFEKSYEFVEAKRSLYKPYYIVSNQQGKGAICFARDPNTALQVWSSEWGYPGDFRYLEFHKKHFPGGLKYWRVTGPKKLDLALKEPYDPARAREAVKEHAKHFVELVKKILVDYYNETGTVGILTAMYDTELFGHWWFEGILWLEEVIKLIWEDDEIELTTFPEYYKEYPPTEVVTLPEGSWGEGGYHYIWLNDDTKWTWEKIYESEDIFFEVVNKIKTETKPIGKIAMEMLKQFLKEFLLLTASDWQFLISTYSARDYASIRFSNHYKNFKKLHKMITDWIEKEDVEISDVILLKELSEKTVIFDKINPLELV